MRPSRKRMPTKLCVMVEARSDQLINLAYLQIVMLRNHAPLLESLDAVSGLVRSRVQ